MKSLENYNLMIYQRERENTLVRSIDICCSSYCRIEDNQEKYKLECTKKGQI